MTSGAPWKPIMANPTLQARIHRPCRVFDSFDIQFMLLSLGC
jgi:hypothetical protein